ncbi:hypothetical protein [Burkholderia plantarii]|uniref:hypothetical protein n=1 Tax=Burkholderia plantarii TaxID=41899 RepID=UPI0018DC0CF7|nr:hypothetical protein [Burkholderia plantarii]MBI0329884.1 hypothetical protein [Burkholderia plantarii]
MSDRYRPQCRRIFQSAAVRSLDGTRGAMVSGSCLPSGMQAARYVGEPCDSPQAGVIGTRMQTRVVNAAPANAMRAHADETDDFEAVIRRRHRRRQRDARRQLPASGRARAGERRGVVPEQPRCGAHARPGGSRDTRRSEPAARSRAARPLARLERLETLKDLRTATPDCRMTFPHLMSRRRTDADA